MLQPKLPIYLRQYSDLRIYFGDLFRALKNQHKRMSRGAFAKKLGISQSSLCNFLEGRRNLSEKMLAQISKNLNWHSDDISHASTLRLIEECTPDGVISEQILSDIKKRSMSASRTLVAPTEAEPTLHLISRILLQAVEIPRYSKEPLLIAKQIGFSEKIVALELEKLIKSAQIKLTKDRFYQRARENKVVQTATSNEVIRRYYRQMLSIASQKVRSDNLNRRYFGTETFTFSAEMLPEAKIIIDTCLDHLSALSERCKEPQSVYHANVHLFDLLEPQS